MKWRWVLLLVIPALFLVVLTVTAVAVFVPIRFTTAAAGRIVPKHRVRVTAARSGLIVYLRDPGPVQKGDVLLRQSTAAEERRMQALGDALSYLDQELRNRIAVAEAVRQATRVDLEIARLDRDQAREEYSVAQQALPKIESDIESKQLDRRKRQQTLAEKEYAILEELAKQQSVPRQEVARGETAAATARLQVEETELVRKKNALIRTGRLKRLRAALRKQELLVEKLAAAVPDETGVIEVRSRIRQLKLDLADIRADMDAKELQAPANGEWGALQVTALEYAPQGTFLGVFTDPARLKFVAFLRSEQAPWVHRGQKALVRLEAFPYLKYGRLEATVANLGQLPTVSGRAAADAYRVELDLAAENQPYTPLPGLAGRADIEVYRGTLLQYLLAEPEQVRGQKAKRRPSNRLLRLLKGR
ncbi:MAG: HlyD family efflux transporter periplasmic adaptor subunit [Kiritimatiellaeota bacterium]|nr:HlyD family efflux transporter periplasmic adaptor subunit [Kiritimatiellota bacterium]